MKLLALILCACLGGCAENIKDDFARRVSSVKFGVEASDGKSAIGANVEFELRQPAGFAK